MFVKLNSNRWNLFIFALTIAFLWNNAFAQNTTTTLNSIVVSTTTDLPTQSSNDSSPVPTNEIVDCTPGGSTGYGLVRKPNITSMVKIGVAYNVSWDWTVTVTKPPTYLDVYVQLFAAGIAEKWNTKVASNVPVDPRWFMWTPTGLVDGKYKLRFVPDGKETFNVPANQLPCFSNGESVPFVTAQFSISNGQGDLGVYPDPYAPSSAISLRASIHAQSNIVMLLILAIVVSLMYVM